MWAVGWRLVIDLYFSEKQCHLSVRLREEDPVKMLARLKYHI